MTLMQMIANLPEERPEHVIQIYKEKDGTYTHLKVKDFCNKVEILANGLLSIGMSKDDKVFELADNRPEWLWLNIAAISINATDVPRGTDSSDKEILYILDKIEAKYIIAENIAQKDRLLSMRDRLPDLKYILILDKELGQKEAEDGNNSDIKILSLQELSRLGEEYEKNHPSAFKNIRASIKEEDVCSIIFTSGSTGNPKGVMITYANFSYFKEPFRKAINPINEIFLSVLPIWHSFERTVEYIMLIAFPSTIVYSKPIGKILLADIAAINPTYFPMVPRLLEVLVSSVKSKISKEKPIIQKLFNFFFSVTRTYKLNKIKLNGLMVQITPRNRFLDIIASLPAVICLSWLAALGDAIILKKIRKMFGTRPKYIISGGAALPKYADEFLMTIGLEVIEGYGLTEASPMISVNSTNEILGNVHGTIGPALQGTQTKIIDIESGRELGLGEVGELWIKGPQIMKGYYNEPEKTAEVIKDGWLNTGDLAMITFKHKCLKIVGRSKDTIVLSGGENVEPSPIEAKANSSIYIDRSVLVGQDKKQICMLVIPKQDTIEEYAKANKINGSFEELIKNKAIIDLIDKEIREAVSIKEGFKSFELIARFKILEKPFEVGQELSAKQDLKRNFIYNRYAQDIEELYN